MNEIKSRPISSKILFLIICVLLGFIFTLLAYRVGVFVGERKAMYSYRWSENYQRNFAGPPQGFLGRMPGVPDDRGFMDAHGIFGTVLKVEGDTLVIQDKDHTEKTVLISPETSIRQGRDSVALDALASSTNIVVIGEPNDQGQIQAKLIRVFPFFQRP